MKLLRKKSKISFLGSICVKNPGPYAPPIFKSLRVHLEAYLYAVPKTVFSCSVRDEKRCLKKRTFKFITVDILIKMCRISMGHGIWDSMMMVVEFHSVTGKSIIHEYIGDFPKGASAWAERREGRRTLLDGDTRCSQSFTIYMLFSSQLYLWCHLRG